MVKDRSLDVNASGSLAVISEGASLDGTLRSTAAVHLSGAFKGKIFAENDLVIGPAGRVEAKVKARKAVIAGSFEGEMVVLEEIEIAPTGCFRGTLIQRAPGLIVAKGGRFEGQSVFADDLDKILTGW